MSDLRKLAAQAMECLADYTVGESPNASAVNDLIADLDAALAQPDPVAAERKACIDLLKGIDQTENESDDGWWETSTGAKFGAGILAAIRARGNHE